VPSSSVPDSPPASPSFTAVAPTVRPPATTREPAPVPRVTPASDPFAINLYEEGDFVSQATVAWCVPGAILTMANMIDSRPARAVDLPGQGWLDRLARSLSTDRLVGPGSEPEGWAGALTELGYGPYEVRAERTREGALRVAARAMRLTDRPVGLLMWRGAHAWVLSGFEASTDPAATTDFDVTHVWIQDPWHPRTSSIWGPGKPPNTRIAVAKLTEDFLPWRRPAVPYPEKDGRFVVVLPIAPPR
jgi:hypothetical protein